MKLTTVFFCCICIALGGCSSLDSFLQDDPPLKVSQPIAKPRPIFATNQDTIDIMTSPAPPTIPQFIPPVDTKKKQEKRRKIEALYQSIQK